MKCAARVFLWVVVGLVVYVASAVATNILSPEVDERLLTGDATGVNLALAVGIGISGMIIAVLWKALQNERQAKEELHTKRADDAKEYVDAMREHRDLMVRTTVLIERMERRMGDA